MARIIPPLKPGDRGAAVGILQDHLFGLMGAGLIFPDDATTRQRLTEALRRESQEFGDVTAQIVARSQEENGLAPTGEVDEETAELLDALAGETEDAADYRVEGRVASRIRAGVAGLEILVVDKGVGGDAELGRTRTDARGDYAVAFSAKALERRGKEKPDLQVRVLRAGEMLTASPVRYNAGPEERIDILLSPTQSAKLASEYEALTERLAGLHRGALADLKETDEQQDITYLANKSGWDARAIALAALADQYGQRSEIEPAYFYALFRAGVPANDASIFRVSPDRAETIWSNALGAGIIPAKLKETLPAAREHFESLAVDSLLETPAPGTAGGLKPLLAQSFDGDDRSVQEFAALQIRHEADPAAFWRAVNDRFGPDTAARLRVDGQLAFLTLNNARLVSRLRDFAGSGGRPTLAALVPEGLYQARRWIDMIDPDTLPEAIPGRSTDERRQNYADYMAAQVRLGYPTAVLADMVRSDETPVASGMRDGVRRFLSDNAETFAIAQEPVRRFVERNTIDVDASVVAEVARIQRVYQITPDDDAMNGLLRAGLDSAHAVLHFEENEFVRAHASDVGGEAQALAVHRKARQVHDTVLNVAMAYIAARQTPAAGMIFGGAAGLAVVEPGPGGPFSDVLAYSTLETLFGEMDYCGCEHCRSVLSPAAYLVDLLMFLDRPGSEIPAGFANPLDVLLERRPDIQHLPLTCENTLTALPYIDLVNEVLEHFIVNGLSLTGYAGHTTDGTRTSDELMANPEFVSDTAYTALAAAEFPPPLPFDLPLETLRALYARFDAPMPEVMEDLRSSDSLDGAGGGYGWRDIWHETLGLSQGAVRLLTESTSIAGSPDPAATAKRLFGFQQSATDAEFRDGAESVKAFCRRTRITPAELVDILRTRFVNPGAALLPRVERLGISFGEIRAFSDGTMSEAELLAAIAPGVDSAAFGGDIAAWLQEATNVRRLLGLIVLSNPSDPDDHCDLEALELRYADPDPAANRLRLFDFVRLGRFIRLWRALGLGIDETDAILSALYPQAQVPDQPNDSVNLGRLDAGLSTVLLQFAIAKRAMADLSLDPKKDLRPLLALFGPIGTHGARALYRTMFLSPSVDDPAFAPDSFGEVLTDPAARLTAHLEPLRAAFSQTGAEADRALTALGFDATTALSIPTVSALFQRGWLARALGLSVASLEELMSVTGLDPFGAQDPTASDLLALIRLVREIEAAGLAPEQALYLIWNVDLSGRSAPDPALITTLARDLRRTLDDIESDFAVLDDPDGTIARTQMALVYGDNATERFFGFIEATVASQVAYDHGGPQLEAAILAAAPDQIGYDDFRKELSFRGVLSQATRTALQAVPGITPAFSAAVDALFAQAASVSDPFFARYPELLALHDAYRNSNDPEPERRIELLRAILPGLREQRNRQQAAQVTGAAAEIDTETMAALFEAPAVLHASDDVARPALDDLVALGAAGLTREVTFAAAPAAVPDRLEPASGAVSHAPDSASPLPPNESTPGAPVSVVWRGYVEAPENGFFNLSVETDPAALVTLTIAGEVVPMANAGGTWTNTAAVEFVAGVLTRMTLSVANVTDGVALRWRTAGRGAEVIPARHLYGAAPVGALQAAFTRALKVNALAGASGLAAPELAHLGARPELAHAGTGWLNHLPVEGGADAATSAALLAALRVCLQFARLKSDLSPGDTRLLEIISDPAAATASSDALLYTVTRWDEASVQALLAHFGQTAADLAEVAVLERVATAMGRTRTLGILAPPLIAATTNSPTGDTVRALKSALRARFDRDSWLDVLKPINDRLRRMQRDALVAHVLHRLGANQASAHIDTPEKLFEFFLMDVQMEPCMLTSRIRNALSSIQIFVERCLMNLEPRVAPESLKAQQWEWMKRYRVWEANRKVFLYPENWLEPELRDDQSPFFREAMSTLLQGEITERAAGQALTTYLRKLEEVAKLEICGVLLRRQRPRPRRRRGARHRPDRRCQAQVPLPAARLRLLEPMGGHRPRHRGQSCPAGGLERQAASLLAEGHARSKGRRGAQARIRKPGQYAGQQTPRRLRPPRQCQGHADLVGILRGFVAAAAHVRSGRAAPAEGGRRPVCHAHISQGHPHGVGTLDQWPPYLNRPPVMGEGLFLSLQ